MSFGIPAALLFGLVLIIASLSLFVTSKLKPNLYEDSDNIYVVVGIVCGLLLLVSLDLGAAMALQQMLMVSAIITLMWRFINLRAENKQLKNRQSPSDRTRSTYNARLEDDYTESPRERQRARKRRNDSYYDDDERRLLRESQESAVDPLLSRRRGRSFDAEDSDRRYTERRDADDFGRSSDWEDESDWERQPTPRKPRRVLPAADNMTSTRALAEESFVSPQGTLRERNDIDIDNESSPRRRRNRSERPRRDLDAPSERLRQRPSNDSRSNSAEGSMAGYVDYEPVDPPSGLPSSGSEPIVFPDRY